MLESELLALGFSLREAKVYLMLLKIDEAPASIVAKRCELPRLTVYSILERLISKGLVNYYEKRNVRVYRVISLNSLLRYCDDEIFSLQSKRDHLQSLIPKFKTYQRGDRATAHTFRIIVDHHHFFNLCVQALQNSSDWLVIHDGSLWQDIVALREHTHKIPRILLPHSQRQKLSRFSPDYPLRSLPDQAIKSPMNGMVVGVNVFTFLVLNDEFSVAYIECPYISEQLRSLFWLLWGMGTA